MPHQERRDIQRPPRDGEPDAVALFLDGGLVEFQPAHDEGQQAVGPGVGLLDAFDILDAANDLVGKRQLTLRPPALGAEGRRLGTHAELRPEAGEEHCVGKRAHRLEIDVQPGPIAGVVVQDGRPRPAGQPGTVDNESNRQRVEDLAAQNSQQFVPLFACHAVTS